MNNYLRNILIATAVAFLAAAVAACGYNDHVRTPPAPVFLRFATINEWQQYGPGANPLDFDYYIKSERLPKDFPYLATNETGYGGVLLAVALTGQPVAMDLSCPIENSQTIRVRVDTKSQHAVCPKCGSRYFVFENYGRAVSGPAAEKELELRRYNVIPTDDTPLHGYVVN